MTSTIITKITLGIVITLISVLWVTTTLKAERKPIEEIQKENIENKNSYDH